MTSKNQAPRTSALSRVATIGLDLAKSSVDFAGLDAAGQVVTRRRCTKAKLAEVTAKLHPCRIGMEACRRLTGIPGVGAQTATAAVAAIDDGKAFETGRDCAAWLGLTPRESSTGGRQRLGRISQQGNPCLRSLLVHGARSSLDTLSQRKDRLGAWLRRLLERNKTKKGRKVAIVALAAGLARVTQAMLSSGQPLRLEAAAARGPLLA